MPDERCELCVCFLPTPPAERVGPLEAKDVPDVASEAPPTLPPGVEESPSAKAEREARKAARVATINAQREKEAAADDARGPRPASGQCRCLPTPVQKLASDWCFQFAARPA